MPALTSACADVPMLPVHPVRKVPAAEGLYCFICQLRAFWACLTWLSRGECLPFWFVLCTLQSFADLPRGSHGPPRYQMKTWFVCCGMLSVFSYTDHGLQLQFQNVSLCRLRRLNAFLPKDPAALPDQVVHGVLVAVNKPPASGAYPEAVLQRKILVFMAATGTGFA